MAQRKSPGVKISWYQIATPVISATGFAQDPKSFVLPATPSKSAKLASAEIWARWQRQDWPRKRAKLVPKCDHFMPGI